MNRKEIYNKINKLTKQQKQIFSDMIIEKVIQTKEYKNANSIFIYKALENEANMDKLIDISLENNKIVAVPITNENMYMMQINKDTKFVERKFNVREPENGIKLDKIDLAIVPMVAFDKNCNRVGHGKGYYDRFLAKHKCFKIGVAFGLQEIDKCEVKETDIKMDKIITENKIYTKSIDILLH